MDADETKESQWIDFRPESFGIGLRCPICLDFFEKPHTLGCGHTFCLSCLYTLAKMARSSTSRAPLDRLRFRCPACRKMTIARPLLRRRASVTIALQDIVDAWFSSPYSVGKLELITLRSTSCQTNGSPKEGIDDHTAVSTSLQNQIEDEAVDSPNVEVERSNEDKDDDKSKKGTISREEYRQVLVHRFSVKSNSKQDLESDVITKLNRTKNTPETNGYTVLSSDVTTETSSSEEESDPELVPLLEEEDPPIRNILAIRSFVSILWLMFEEILTLFRGIRNSRGKMTLTVFWFFYAGLIICFSRAFIPWMILYTMLYFLIMYVEMSRPFIIRY